MNEQNSGTARPVGDLAHRRTRDLGDLSIAHGERRAGLAWRLRNFLEHRHRGMTALTATMILGRLFGACAARARLQGVVYRPDWSRLHPEQILKLRALLAENHDVRDLARGFGGDILDYGLLSTRLVTNNGVAFIVDAFQNLVELENLHFHGYGTGTNAEAAGDSALQTELTTQYATDNVRPTGTTTESAANIYRTVATLSPDSGGTIAVTEHGIFSQAATGGGTLLDRSVFSAVNLVAGSDSLQTTYDLTLTAGG